MRLENSGDTEKVITFLKLKPGNHLNHLKLHLLVDSLLIGLIKTLAFIVLKTWFLLHSTPLRLIDLAYFARDQIIFACHHVSICTGCCSSNGASVKTPAGNASLTANLKNAATSCHHIQPKRKTSCCSLHLWKHYISNVLEILKKKYIRDDTISGASVTHFSLIKMRSEGLK